MTVPVGSCGKLARIRASIPAAPGDSTKRGRAPYQFRPSDSSRGLVILSVAAMLAVQPRRYLSCPSDRLEATRNGTLVVVLFGSTREFLWGRKSKRLPPGIWFRGTRISRVFVKRRKTAKHVIYGKPQLRHPSAILRAPDEDARRQELKRFIDDLKKVAQLL